VEGQFNTEFDFPTILQEDSTSFSTFDSSYTTPGSHFASGIHNLVGEDAEPDPLFFVESWTVGASRAAENLKQRRQAQSGFQPQTHTFDPSIHLGAEFFVQQSQQSTQFNSSRYAASRPAYAEGFATNAHQTSQDRSEASPRGNETSHQPNQPMTLHLALQILEVTATSTQSEIKSAYRRLVNEWHPDRFEGKSERARQLATTKMSAINKAYQFLRNTL
jgi:hypothetical protein